MDDSKVAVLLEDINSQRRAIGNGLLMLNEKVDRKFDAFESANSKEHRLIMQMITELREEQEQLKHAK